MLASAIRSIFKTLKECGRCKTGLRLSESLFLFLFFHRSSVERYFVIGGFRNPLLLFERLSSSLSAVIDPVRLFTRPFRDPLFSTDILRAARAAPLVAVDGTSRARRVRYDFNCNFFPFFARERYTRKSRISYIDCYFDEFSAGRETCGWNE